MAVVLNTDLKEVKVQVFGNYFTFKPGQIKQMDDRIAQFLCTDRGHLGFQSLSEECTEIPLSDKCKAEVEAKTEAGRKRIVDELTKRINNLEVSLKRDLDQAGIKTDVLNMATDGDMEAYKHLAMFKKLEKDANELKRKEIERLKGVISGNTDQSDAGPSN